MRVQYPKPVLAGLNQKRYNMVYLVYKTDSHHSYASRDIIGVATTFKVAVDLCVQQARKESDKIDEDQMWNLINIKQTQGYSGNGEFQFESMETDVLI